MSESNNQTTQTIQQSITGFPSLGLPKLPEGFDGTMRSDDATVVAYEQIIADVFHKCNEAFINAPHQRDVRPGYFKVVVGDLADALASVVPCERARGTRAPTDTVRKMVGGDVLGAPLYKTPDAAMDVVIDKLTPDMLKRICERHGLKKRMTHAEYYTVAEGCKLTRFNGTNATRLVAVRKGLEGNADVLFEISVDHDNSTAVIERDGEMLYKIRTLGLTYRRVIHAAINVLRSHLHENDRVHREHYRNRQRRAEERIEQEINRELDATIARQMGDDDLAEQIENA